MAKFSHFAKTSDVTKGIRALKKTEFTCLDGTVATCALRPLLGRDDALILSEARAFAISKGLKEPKDGDHEYELGKAVHTLRVACVDIDDPTGETPFFDEGADQILAHLDRERIFLLFEMQAAWQDEKNPHSAKMSVDEYITAVYEHAKLEEGAELPFESYPPVLRRSFTLFTAKMCAAFLEARLPTSLDSNPSIDEPTKRLDS